MVSFHYFANLMDKIEIRRKLSEYLPAECLKMVENLLEDCPVSIKTVRPRKTKLGDYRPPGRNTACHRITLNSGLNPSAFLLVLLHEIAHLQVWQVHKNTVKQHGIEWSNAYKKLLHTFFNSGVFSGYSKQRLAGYLRNPVLKPGLCYLMMLEVDDSKRNALRVEDLPMNAVFVLLSGRKLRKLSLIRKRYRCMDISSKKIYSVHPQAVVEKYE